MARTEPWRVSDEFWEKVQPLIPPAPSHAKGGRTRMDDREAFAAMIYVLRTGIQWNALPREMGASSTVHDRYQEWERLGFSLRSCGGRGSSSTRSSGRHRVGVAGHRRGDDEGPFRTRRDRQEPHRPRQDGDET
jgi:hypothetical protein